MAKARVQFECSECGYRTAKWMGSCPSCGKWNSLQEVTEQKQKKSKKDHKARLNITDSNGERNRPRKLSEINTDEAVRMMSGIPELDRVLGGGFLKGSFVLLGGDPGIGKSTLMLQLAKGNPDMTILYCSGEESAEQIRQRSERLGVKSENLLVYTETELDAITAQASSTQPDLLIIDSIQTVYRTELTSMPGSVQQVRECAAMLQKLAKSEGITTLIIGHVTKEGDLAGPRILEHMVDTVLQFEGDSNYTYRMLRTLKNRFGPAHEIGIFEMREEGLRDIENPSEFFVSDFNRDISGNALVCTLEGTRPLIIEVQALVTPTNYGMPQRTTTGFDHKKLSLLLAVLEKRCSINLSKHDVYLNVAGGIRINDPACDLGVACALTSSLYDKPLKQSLVLLGEVGLGAELRSISKVEQRLNEIKKMGIEHVVAPVIKNAKKRSDIQLSHRSDLKSALNVAFRGDE